MAKWKNTSSVARIAGHVLVLPGETVEVPEKMLKVLNPQKQARPAQSKKTQAELPTEGEEKTKVEGE